MRRLPLAEKLLLNLAASGIVMAFREAKEDVLFILRRGGHAGLELL